MLGDAGTLSTDDYVVGDRVFRRQNLEGGDPIKKYFPQALNDHIAKIKALEFGERLPVPEYDERTGEAVSAEQYSKSIGKVKYLIVEGDFDFVENPDLLIYFDVPDEVRLHNRIVRDRQIRGETDNSDIIDNFNLRQELQHIPHTLPAKDKADLIVRAHAAERDNDGKVKYEYELEKKQ